ncbi:MAG TPA: hypothetical protein VFI24_09385 [Pyrinomonadaceae bacterium]|nr:hypothetical protein [Pyrinomonadaceae bacterium]
MEEQEYRPKSHWGLLILGVIMPAISITVEATTHICGIVFFDPIPSVWHLLLVIFVPLAQLQVWFVIRRGSTDRLRLAGLLNAIVIGISIFYSIVYLSLVPLALLAILFGIGFLPLVPYFSLITALVMRHKLNRIAATSPQKSFTLKNRGLLAGVGLALAIFGVLQLPATLTRIGLQKAVSASPQTQAEGIRFLRSYGSRDALLRSCYNQTGLAPDLIGYVLSLKDPVTPAEAQKIYYRVTGETFDLEEPPERVAGRVVPQETIDFDRDQGGRSISGKLKGLSLADSKIEGTVDSFGGVGYLEWTLVFRNVSAEQREARAEVQLPPGGVVSRLSLWVNGEPREAAFAGRNKVTSAYQQVAIRQRRDPVLVTTAGRDRILVQCFPVPVSGEMKIRFGISVPLLLEDRAHVRLLLPHFANRNFRIPDDVKHAVRIKSQTEMMWTSLYTPDNLTPQYYGLTANLTDTELSLPISSISQLRGNFDQMWSPDPFNKEFVIQQKIEEHSPAHLRRIVVVVDTSEPMRSAAADIQSAIKTLPLDFDVKLVLTESDGNGAESLPAIERGEISSRLDVTTFAGGTDNAPALRKAWDLAAETPGNNAIVWIHHPQRLLIDSVDTLKQRWENRPYGPTLYSVRTASDTDEIERQLDRIDEMKSVARTSDLATDLKNLFARLTGSEKTLAFVRSSKKIDDQSVREKAIMTSDHLARLWANDEVARILAPRDSSLEDEAIALAAQYQLVTPVSGAVVLETDQQYRANDLKPVNAGTVPTIPEPEMVALLIIAGGFLIWITFMKYRKSGSGRCTV